MAMAYLYDVKLLIYFVEFVHFQDKDLSLIYLALNMLITTTCKSRQRHLNINIAFWIIIVSSGVKVRSICFCQTLLLQ